jgi:rsbT co-antagonist protein RsbR
VTSHAEGSAAEQDPAEAEVEVLRARVAELEAEADGLRRMVAQQASVIAEVVTPLIPISNRVVVMPIIGVVDEARAGEVISTLLQGVARTRARVVILDVTGVAQADAQVAQALGAAARTVELLGARVMLTGIQPQMARAFVELGVDLDGIPTQRTLRDGITRATRLSGRLR